MIKASEEKEEGLSHLLPELTPMLDMLFILVLFFMLTTGAAIQALDLTLPETSAKLPMAKGADNISIEIHPRVYKINQQSIKSFPQFKRLLKQKLAQNPNQKVVIAGEKSVSIERLLQVLVYLQKENIKGANILLQNQPSP